MAPQSKEMVALLALCACWDVLREEEQPCFEPSASHCRELQQGPSQPTAID